MFNLKGGRADTCISEQVHDELDAEVADTNATSKTLLSDGFHRGPGLLDCSIACHESVVLVEEPRGVANGRIDIFQRNGEVDDIKIKVVDAPVGKLLPADGLDPTAVVERVPKFGN